MLRSINCWLFHVDRLDKECSTSMSTRRALATALQGIGTCSTIVLHYKYEWEEVPQGCWLQMVRDTTEGATNTTKQMLKCLNPQQFRAIRNTMSKNLFVHINETFNQMYLGKNFVSDGTFCTTFCTKKPKNKNCRPFTQCGHVRVILGLFFFFKFLCSNAK